VGAREIVHLWFDRRVHGGGTRGCVESVTQSPAHHVRVAFHIVRAYRHGSAEPMLTPAVAMCRAGGGSGGKKSATHVPAAAVFAHGRASENYTGALMNAVSAGGGEMLARRRPPASRGVHAGEWRQAAVHNEGERTARGGGLLSVCRAVPNAQRHAVRCACLSCRVAASPRPAVLQRSASRPNPSEVAP